MQNERNKMTWDERAKAVFAQGCNTYSKRSDQYIEGVYPTHYEDFQGVDYVCGLGSNLIDIQNNFSLPSTQEVILGERVKALFPCIDKLKIVKTGSAACSAAVRIARAYSTRTWILGSGYHGTDDWAISAEDPGAGTLKDGERYQKAKSIDEIEKILKGDTTNQWGQEKFAAVIIEPVQLDVDVSIQLQAIRELCTQKKIVLIFDEVITGFRFPKYSAANYFGIQPDIICLGKALGNGFPIAIVGGREDIMETPGYFISNTHNGELSGIQAALNTLDFLTEEKIQDLWSRGEYLNREFNKLSPKIQMVGYPTRSELQGDEMFKALFMQEAFERGQFFGRARFLTFAHTWEIIEETLKVCREVIPMIELGSVKLKGQLPRPVFRRN
jgi:glutamate-1-semialdehyde aminotransferase